MPAILTHDFFGQDAFGTALGVLAMFTPDERDAFLLGNQGPDPLFYLQLTPPLKAFQHLGNDMHAEEPSKLLVRMRRAVDGLDEAERPVGRAYLAGFVCHYLLDRAVHPLVYYWERGICQAGIEDLDGSDHNIVHAEIERDLDEAVLYAKRHETIVSYRPYEEVLRASDDVLRTIGKVYFEAAVSDIAHGERTATRVYPIAVRCFRVAQRMFFSPKGRKMSKLAKLESPILHNRYSLVRAMSHRVRAQESSPYDNHGHNAWRNPFTGKKSDRSFWDLYERTLDEVEPTLQQVFADDFDEPASAALTLGLNFSGEPMEA